MIIALGLTIVLLIVIALYFVTRIETLELMVSNMIADRAKDLNSLRDRVIDLESLEYHRKRQEAEKAEEPTYVPINEM